MLRNIKFSMVFFVLLAMIFFKTPGESLAKENYQPKYISMVDFAEASQSMITLKAIRYCQEKLRQCRHLLGEKQAISYLSVELNSMRNDFYGRAHTPGQSYLNRWLEILVLQTVLDVTANSSSRHANERYAKIFADLWRISVFWQSMVDAVKTSPHFGKRRYLDKLYYAYSLEYEWSLDRLDNARRDFELLNRLKIDFFN